MREYKKTIIAIPLVLGSCSAGQHLSDGEYLLDKVEVKSDKKGFDTTSLKPYVRQKEPPKIFSLFKNPFGKHPAIYDTAQARLSCHDLLTAMQNQGYMHASVSLDTLTRGKRLTATYLLHPGEPFTIGEVAYDVEDEGIQRLLHLDKSENQHLKPGMTLTVDASTGSASASQTSSPTAVISASTRTSSSSPPTAWRGAGRWRSPCT